MRRLAVAFLFLPTALSAQVVRGIVRDSLSGEPASGVLVALVQRASDVRRTVLTDAGGRFTLAAPGAGSYTLEIKRIGVRPVLTPDFTLGEGEAREISATVAPVVARLEAVRVTGRSYCGARVREAVETATLWEEVRAALTATRISREVHSAPVTLTSFRRTLDPTTFEVRAEERSERHGMTSSNPFFSAPAASLSAHGYVVSDGEDLLYRGPDPEVLLSDAFVREHCFRAVLGTSERVGLIGLSFEPTSARRVPDIAGVLWIDGGTRELRRLEYRYTRPPIEVEGPFPLSYIDFARLPSGAWFVQRWAIRAPHMTQIGARQASTNPLVAGEPPRHRLIAVLEIGGEATIGVRQASRGAYEVEGTVFDSTAGHPLDGARVFLRGTSLTATANAAGRFRIQLPDSGSYMLTFEHPRLDSLNFDAPARSVRVAAALTTVDVAVPPLVTIRAALCPGAKAMGQNGIVHGTLRNQAGAPMAWATLKYQWARFAVAGTPHTPLPTGASVPVPASAPAATYIADSRGRYLICDVPPGHYRLTIESETGEVAESEVLIGARELVMRNLTLRRR
jgi:hypothetical protein